jgi:hypothetical protein
MPLRGVFGFVRASREFHNAVDALTTAFRQRKSEAESDEAIETMEEEKASRAFTEKFFNNSPSA